MIKKSFDEKWEKNIYGRGEQFNNYPHDLLVSLIARNFFKFNKAQRKKIRILDLGCGAGNNAKFLAENGFSVYGIDGSKTAIKFCRQKFAKLKLKADFKPGDFLNLPYEDNYFDAVIDRESLYANRPGEIKKILEQVHKKLKPGGLFISFMFSTEYPESKLGKKIEYNTFDRFPAGSSFYGSGVSHFTDLKEINQFFSKFKIKSVMRHSLKQVLGRSKGM